MKKSDRFYGEENGSKMALIYISSLSTNGRGNYSLLIMDGLDMSTLFGLEVGMLRKDER